MYRTTTNQELRIDKLYTAQGEVQIYAILDHIWRDTEIDKLLGINMEHVKLDT